MDRMAEVIAAVQQSQFPPHLDHLIQLFLGGSKLHGAKVKDTDHLDIFAIYIEPPESAVGLRRDEFFVANKLFVELTQQKVEATGLTRSAGMAFQTS